jgi:hypothetical protein
VSLASSAYAQPTVATISPAALAPGKATEVTLTGTKLPAGTKVWTSFPSQVEVVAPAEVKDATKLICKFTLDARLPVGMGGIIVVTPEGQTDVVPLMIDDLPLVAEAGANNVLTSPQELTLPVAVAGASNGNVFDYFRFTAKANQRINVDVWAARWGQDYDPVLRLLDASGKELLLADDDAAFGADCRLSFVAPTDGQYVIELRDNRYKAGGKYHLRIGDFPLVTSVFPLAISTGIGANVTFVGPAVEGVPTQSLLLPFGAAAGLNSLAARLPGGQTTSAAKIAVSSLPVTSEVTDDAQTPPVAAIPGVLTGRFDTPADADRFQFQATKGMRVTFQAQSRSLGSPAIVAMRVLNAAGAQLVESAPTEADEETLVATIPEDGVYQLVAADLLGRGGNDFTYKIDVVSGPTFRLVQKKDPKAAGKFVVPNGGAFYLDVQAVRGGYDGPIKLSLANVRGDWQLVNDLLPAKANDVRLYLLPPRDWSPGDLATLTIEGTADASGGNRTAELSRIANFRTSRPTWPYPPEWAAELISVSGSAAKPFFVAVADRNEVLFPRQLGQAKFTVHFERLDDAFKDVPLTLLFPQLPPGITTEVKRSAPGAKETYEVTLKGAKDLAEARHTLRYFAFSEFQGRGQGELSGSVAVNILSPLAATVTPAGSLVQGKTVKVKLAIMRRGEDKQPVELKFKALPQGVTGPEKIAFAPDQHEMEVELTAAADAPVAKFEQLAVSATTKYAGQDIAVDSPNVALEVKAP